MLASRAILKRLRKGANVQLLMDLAPLRDAWHGAQAQPALAASQPRTGDGFRAIQRP